MTNYEMCESMLYTSITTIEFYVKNSSKEETEYNEKRAEFEMLMDIVPVS